jgi:hypothetical protein
MTWLLIALLSAILAELFLRLPLLARAGDVAAIGRRSLRTLRAQGASDHWKERCLLGYAGRMMRGAGAIALWFAGWSLAAAALVALAGLVRPGLPDAMASWPGAAAALAASLAVLAARRRRV